jgi:hypothetical protein
MKKNPPHTIQPTFPRGAGSFYCRPWSAHARSGLDGLHRSRTASSIMHQSPTQFNPLPPFADSTAPILRGETLCPNRMESLHSVFRPPSSVALRGRPSAVFGRPLPSSVAFAVRRESPWRSHVSLTPANKLPQFLRELRFAATSTKPASVGWNQAFKPPKGGFAVVAAALAAGLVILRKPYVNPAPLLRAASVFRLRSSVLRRICDRLSAVRRR